MITNLYYLGTVVTKYLQNNYCLRELQFLLKDYNHNDWKKYVQINETQYSKQCVFRNDYIDMFIITWNSLQKSPIHNHSQFGCLQKILQGSLTEKMYSLDNLNEPFQINQLHKNHISYLDDTIGYHSIQNEHPIKISASLHIYSPPNFKTNYYLKSKL